MIEKEKQKKLIQLGIIAIIVLCVVILLIIILNSTSNKMEHLTTDDLVCEEGLTECEIAKMGKIMVSVKDKKLYLNDNILFADSGEIGKGQLEYDITSIDDENLFITVIFGSEHEIDYVFGGDGKESIDLNSLTNLLLSDVEYKDNYFYIKSMSDQLYNAYYDGIDCDKLEEYDNKEAGYVEEKIEYLGNGKLGEKEKVLSRTVYEEVSESCKNNNE